MRNAGRAVRLLERPHRGKGAAVTAGLAGSSAAYAGFCDLDLSTPLDDLERVYHAATRAEVLATGSRDLATSTLVRPGARYARVPRARLQPPAAGDRGARHRRHAVRCEGRGPIGVGADPAVVPESGIRVGRRSDRDRARRRRPGAGGADRVAPRRPIEGARASRRLRDGARDPAHPAGRRLQARRRHVRGRAARCSTTSTPSCSWSPTDHTGGSAARRRSSPLRCAAPPASWFA